MHMQIKLKTDSNKQYTDLFIMLLISISSFFGLDDGIIHINMHASLLIHPCFK